MSSQYNKSYLRLTKRIEKGIMAAIAVCLIVLLTGEMLIQYQPVRAVLIETERLEGASGTP